MLEQYGRQGRQKTGYVVIWGDQGGAIDPCRVHVGLGNVEIIKGYGVDEETEVGGPTVTGSVDKFCLGVLRERIF